MMYDLWLLLMTPYNGDLTQVILFCVLESVPYVGYRLSYLAYDFTGGILIKCGVPIQSPPTVD